LLRKHSFRKLKIAPPRHFNANPILVSASSWLEGETDIRRINSEVLTCSGYEVDTVADGAAAWETLQHNNYDLLVSAQHLSKVSGVELVKKCMTPECACRSS
jgi:CheY-like chemotaxis protein